MAEIKWAVLRAPNHVLVGVEKEGFTLVRLGEEYGEGTYTLHRFVDGKLVATFYQVVDPRLGPAKKVDPLPMDEMPGPVPIPPRP